MKNIKSLLFIVALTILGTAHAGPVESFCAEVSQEHAEKTAARVVGTFLWKFIFNPASLVEVQKISSGLPEITQPNRTKIAFLSLPFAEISKPEREELKKINTFRKKTIKALKQRSFHKALSLIKDPSQCIDYIQKENLTEKLIQLDLIAPRYFELKQLETDVFAFKEQNKKKSFLKKDGWRIFENKNLNEIYSLISAIKPTDILLVGHASSDGKMYDAFKNPLPKSYFSALDIHNLIIYSCYSEESKNYYSFNNYNLFIASPTSFAGQFLDNSVPLNSIKVIKNIELKNIEKNTPKLCALEFPIQTSSRLLGVIINKTFIGALSSNVQFPCSLLKEKNTLEIFSTLNERQIGSIGFSTAYIKNISIHLDEFITTKNNRHIVSRGTF